MKTKTFLIIQTIVLIFSTTAFCCGFPYPRQVLLEGDYHLLKPPTIDYTERLIQLSNTVPKTVQETITNGRSLREFTDQTDFEEFTNAVNATNLTDNDKQLLLDRYIEIRNLITDSTDEIIDLEKQQEIISWLTEQFNEGPVSLQQFFSYLKGACYYHFDDIDNALLSWKLTLSLPEDQRIQRSVWATYMIARSLHDDQPGEALRWYREMDDLVTKGLPDSLNLHQNSYGWQASIIWNLDSSASAFGMFLQLSDFGSIEQLLEELTTQYDTSDGDLSLQPFINDDWARQIVTIYILSSKRSFSTEFSDTWFNELLSVSDHFKAEADLIALYSYKLELYDLCEQWLEQAEESLLASRLWVKIYLLKGEVNKAVAHLAQLIRMLPAEDKKQITSTDDDIYENGGKKDISSLLLGDLGTLYLSRGLYIKALDTLYKGGYWVDTAYIAEQVLSADELREYVNTLDQNGEDIRYLLARRLIREQHFDEAKVFLPEEQQSNLSTYKQLLQKGYAIDSYTNRQRSDFLIKAARLIEETGMELLATEVDPDWFVFGCELEMSTTAMQRQRLAQDNIAKMGSNEKMRVANQSDNLPHHRFHYRYLAADIAWDAAKLLPDNSDKLAMTLCEAGGWLKDRDPDAADRFYKSLVRRARLTNLGIAAEEKRWFPDCDL